MTSLASPSTCILLKLGLVGIGLLGLLGAGLVLIHPASISKSSSGNSDLNIGQHFDVFSDAARQRGQIVAAL